jgi:hypothetical protein
MLPSSVTQVPPTSQPIGFRGDRRIARAKSAGNHKMCRIWEEQGLNVVRDFLVRGCATGDGQRQQRTHNVFCGRPPPDLRRGLGGAATAVSPLRLAGLSGRRRQQPLCAELGQVGTHWRRERALPFVLQVQLVGEMRGAPVVRFGVRWRKETLDSPPRDQRDLLGAQELVLLEV